jgi:arylsulfatase A-like enzyme
MMPRTLLVAAVVSICGGLTASPVRQPRPSSLVIITLDTTRADRLPAYGFAGVATPVIDRIVNEGVVFDTAESVAPLTLTAHTSLFTGLYPPNHGVRDNVAPPLGPAHVTLAEILRARGYRTAAFVGSIVLARDRGLARGFDVYGDGARTGSPAPRRRSANEVIDDASAWVRHLDATPFFVWVHLYDAHAPQAPPLEFRRAYGDSYEGAIAYMDAEIGRLLDVLQQKALLATSAVVIAGDHGESLGEHGEREHGIFLYEGATHVPLVVRAPGVSAGRIAAVTSLVDILPTMLDLFGLVAPAAIDGRSLAPALRGKPLPERAVYAESMYAKRFGWTPLRMLRDGGLKYIDAPRPELYDLSVDPFEQRDLSIERPLMAASMRARVAAIAAGPASQVAGAASVEPDRARSLASLGYVSGGPVPPAASATGPGRDPKDYIQLFNEIRGRARQ